MGSIITPPDFHTCAQINTPKTDPTTTDPTSTGKPGFEALDKRSLWPNGTVLQVKVIG
jgi:hypothetical protein